MTNRRTFLTGLSGFVACAPAVVCASSLMRVKAHPVAVAVPADSLVFMTEERVWVWIGPGQVLWGDSQNLYEWHPSPWNDAIVRAA